MIYLVYSQLSSYCMDLNLQYKASQHLLCNMHSFIPFSTWSYQSFSAFLFPTSIVALWNILPSALTSTPSLKHYTHSFHYSCYFALTSSQTPKAQWFSECKIYRAWNTNIHLQMVPHIMYLTPKKLQCSREHNQLTGILRHISSVHRCN